MSPCASPTSPEQHPLLGEAVSVPRGDAAAYSVPLPSATMEASKVPDAVAHEPSTSEPLSHEFEIGDPHAGARQLGELAGRLPRELEEAWDRPRHRPAALRRTPGEGRTTGSAPARCLRACAEAPLRRGLVGITSTEMGTGHVGLQPCAVAPPLGRGLLGVTSTEMGQDGAPRIGDAGGASLWLRRSPPFGVSLLPKLHQASAVLAPVVGFAIVRRASAGKRGGESCSTTAVSSAMATTGVSTDLPPGTDAGRVVDVSSCSSRPTPAAAPLASAASRSKRWESSHRMAWRSSSERRHSLPHFGQFTTSVAFVCAQRDMWKGKDRRKNRRPQWRQGNARAWCTN